MNKLILITFTILTLATAAYAQFPSNKVAYVSHNAQGNSNATVKADIISEPTAVKVVRLAKEAKFEWPNYLLSLATCENDGFDPVNDNKGGNHPATSTDRGQFMINDYYHAEVTTAQAHDIVFATNWTMKQIRNGEQHEWVCDKTAKRIAKIIKGDLYKMNEEEILKVVEQLKIEKSKSK